MTKNYREITAATSATLAKLRADIPETTRGFSTLAQAALKDGALDKKTKELIAMSLSIGARCDPCLGYHAEALVKLGCTRAEFEEMLGMCIYMGGGPSLMYAAHALQAFEEFGGAPAATPAATPAAKA
jgi:AhpD family alkylhydroperoxidase